MRPRSRFPLFRSLLPLAFVALGLLATACGDGGAATAVQERSTVASNQPATPTATAGGSPAATASPAASPAGGGVRTSLGSPAGGAFTQKAPDFEPLPGATADFGTLGGSLYRVEMPADWNGELVLYLHGVRLGTNELSVTSPDRALREAWMAEGYGWAASSYSENGYVPGVGADDTLALLDYVTETYGAPERVYLYGVSMGGHVATLLLEHFPDLFDGGLSVCGAVAGEQQIDYLIAWAMAAEYIAGVRLPDGSGMAAMAAALTGDLRRALGTPDALTAKGAQFLSVARELGGGERPFFLEGFRDTYDLNFGLLLLDPDRAGIPAAAATNDYIEYDIAPGLGIDPDALNDGIRRLAADPAARDAAAHPDGVPTTGRITVPLLTLHNTGDVFVPIWNEQEYADRVEDAGAGDLLVQRAIRAPGHCNFSDSELTTAWEDLRDWVEDGTRPAGEDLRGDLSNAGLEFTNPRDGDPGGR